MQDWAFLYIFGSFNHGCVKIYFYELQKLMKILVTGAAGFIGFHLTQRLLDRGDEVVGIDSINDYYDVNLKYARLAECGITKANASISGMRTQSDKYPQYTFIRMALEEREALQELFTSEKFNIVVNLAAQAGVRYSIENPHAYIDSNIVGFTNILECVRHNNVAHLVYASSSSVYGENTKTPFSEDDRVDNPVSLYAATKRSNELMAAVYAKLYGMHITGLRFFTVYGPWGRPDMAPMLFSKAITSGEAIKVFNNGELSRDFTYIDDIIEGIVRVIDTIPQEESPAEIYNIGYGSPIQLMEFISTLEDALDTKANIQMMPMQKGDVYTTYADTTKLERNMGYKPVVTLQEGIAKYVEWYKSYIAKNNSN